METTLSKDVQEKLVYGQMTDLVFASKEDFSGLLSLRASMDTSGEKPEMKVKVFTMEKPKTMADTLYLYRQPITSEKVKEALLERGEWIGPDGKKAYGNLNVNGGRPISINLDGKKQQFLVSIHQPTNRVVGMSVDSVRSFFFDKDNNLRGKGMYGVPFTAEQANALIEGKGVVHSGQRKDGEDIHNTKIRTEPI